MTRRLGCEPRLTYMDNTPLPTAQRIVDAVLRYRDGDTTLARFDLQAAVDHAPGCETCSHRFGNDLPALEAALALLP